MAQRFKRLHIAFIRASSLTSSWWSLHFGNYKLFSGSSNKIPNIKGLVVGSEAGR